MPSFHIILNRLLIAITVPLLLAACSGGGPSMSSEQTTTALTEASTEAAQTQQSYQSTEAGASMSAVPASEMTTVFGSIFTGQSMGTLAHENSNPRTLERHHWVWNENLSPADWEDHADLVHTHDDLSYQWDYSIDSTAKTALFTVDWAGGGTPTITDAYNYEMERVEEVPVALTATLTGGGTEVGSAVANYRYFNCAADGNTSTEVTKFDSNGKFGPDGEQLKFVVAYELDESGDPDVITSTGNVDLNSGGKHTGFDWDFTVRGTMQRENCVPLGFEPSSGTLAFNAAAGSHTVAFVANFDNVKRVDQGNVVIDPDITSVDVNGSFKINSKTAFTFNGTFDDANGNGMAGDKLTLTFAGGESTTLEAYMQDSMAPAALAALNFLR